MQPWSQGNHDPIGRPAGADFFGVNLLHDREGILRRRHWRTLASVATIGACLVLLSGYAHAACSQWMGQVFFNEYYFGTNGQHFLEIYSQDKTFSSTTWANWKIDVYSALNTKTTYSGSTHTRTSCTAGSKTWGTIEGASMSLPQANALVVLRDENDDPVDVMAFDNNAPPASWASAASNYFPGLTAQCGTLATRLNTQAAASTKPYYGDNMVVIGNYGNKDLGRFPDGNGKWSESGLTGSNTTSTKCGSNSATLSKTASSAEVAPGSTFTWTVSMKNTGNTSLSNQVITDTIAKTANAPALTGVSASSSCTSTSSSTTVGAFSATGGTWTIVSLPTGATCTLTVTATAPATAATSTTPTKSYTNTVTTTIAGGGNTSYVQTDSATVIVRPYIAIASASTAEGVAGTKSLDFIVSLDSVYDLPVTVSYATTDGTATTTDGDYVATSGTLTIPAGQTSGTISVTINGDTKYEADETFTLTLSNPSNAAIQTATATGTINNDDTAPVVSITGQSVTEGNSGTVTLTFTVNLNVVSGLPVTVSYASGDGSATTANGDYVAASGSLTIPAGQTSATIAVTINGDTVYEADEAFAMTLSSPVNATLGTVAANGIILNDDAPPLKAEYRMDEAAWNGTSGEVKDTSGNSYHGTAILAKAGVDELMRAYTAGSQSTCNYGVFDGGTISKSYVSISGWPAFTNGVSITAWIRSTSAAVQHQPIMVEDDNQDGWGLSLAAGTGTAIIRLFNRNLTFSAPTGGVIGVAGNSLDTTYQLASDTWYFVAATVDVFVGKATIYVYGIDGTQLAKASASFAPLSWPSGSGSAAIGGETSSSVEGQQAGWHFLGTIDEVRVYDGAQTQTKVEEIRQYVRPCGVTGPDHYELSLPTTTVSCLPQTVKVTACSEGTNVPCTPYILANLVGQSVTLATDAGTLGSTTLTFPDASGSVTTTLSYPSAADNSTAKITLSNETLAALQARKCCPDGINCVVTNSCTTTMKTAGFIVTDQAGTQTSIANQVAGVTSGTYYLRAVRSSGTSTAACEDVLKGDVDVDVAYECNAPKTCLATDWMTFTGAETKTIRSNNDESLGTPISNYDSVKMNFDKNNDVAKQVYAASFTLNYGDVGETTLHFRKDINTAVLRGESNNFVVKPYSFVLTDIKQTASPNTVNPEAVNASGGKFVRAGEGFSATVSSVNASCAASLSNYRLLSAIPATCITPSFGLEGMSPAETVTLSNVTLPGQTDLTNNPTLGNNESFGAFSGGSASSSTLKWDEVGIIVITPSLKSNNYMNRAGGVTGTVSPNVGRFYPDHFGVTSATLTTRSDITLVPPQTASTFTYMGEPMKLAMTLTAFGRSNDSLGLKNYAGSYAKLNAPELCTGAGSSPCTETAASDDRWFSIGCSLGTPCMGLAAVGGATELTSRLAIDTTSNNSVAPTNSVWTNGASEFTLNFALARGGAPDGPFSTLKIGVKPLDKDGVTLAPRDTAATPIEKLHCADLDVSTGAENAVSVCDPTPSAASDSNFRRKLTTTDVRFGRLRLSNVFGSVSPLKMPVEALYWSGKAWIKNINDSLTNVSTGNVAVSGWTATGPSTLANGEGFIMLTPSAAGKVSVCADVDDNNALDCSATTMNQPWLQSNWGGAATHTVDPSATATFGIYAPEHKKIIHIRELY